MDMAPADKAEVMDDLDMSHLSLSQDRIDNYFANLNPLASKIWRDVKKIEASVDNFDALSYDQKCAIIDRRFMEGVREQDRDEGNDYLPLTEQDYTSSLLMAVYPKKPDKYIYDDNSCWIDSHSGSPTAASMSQVNACKLGGLYKKITFKRASKKYKAPPKPTFFDNKQDQEKESLETDDFPFQIQNMTQSQNQNQHQSNANANVLSTMTEGKKDLLVSSGFFPSPSTTAQTATKVENNDDDNLPNQKQNLELIAELQAKLKKNRNDGKAVLNPVSTSSIPKITKPKAPPPPPPQTNKVQKSPKATATNSNIKSTESKGAVNEKNKSKDPMDKDRDKISGKPVSSPKVGKAEDEFKVDISSPCRIATPKTGFDFLDNW